MSDPFKINLPSKTKWKLLTWLYYIFYIKAVISVGVKGRNVDCISKLKIPTCVRGKTNGPPSCFLSNNKITLTKKLVKTFHKTIDYRENKILNGNIERKFNINSYNFTHNYNLNLEDESSYWSSYYNRKRVKTNGEASVTRQEYTHYSPQVQQMNMYHRNTYQIPNPYHQMGVNYYNPQMTQLFGQPYDHFKANMGNIGPQGISPGTLSSHHLPYQMGPIGQSQFERSQEGEFKPTNIKYVSLRKDLERRKQLKYSSFKIYTDVVWWNDDQDDWPGVTKIKQGVEYPGIIHYYFTPFDALVLLVDKKVEGSVSLSDLPPEFSKSTIKETFKIDHLIMFKLKDPLEFDEKGRPKLVPSLKSTRTKGKYEFRSKVRGKPIFFTNSMGVFKLEDNENYAQVFIVNTGIHLTFPIQHKMMELFTKGEIVEMEVIKTPAEPKASGYLCRIPFDSAKWRELRGKYEMINDVLSRAHQSNVVDRDENTENNEDSEINALSNYKRTRDKQNSYFNEFEEMLPYESESCSLRDFVKRIGGDLKVVVSYISLKTKGIVNPLTNISRTMAKIILNFVKERKVFEIDKEKEEIEFNQFKENNTSQVDERRAVVALLGGPGEGKSSLFRILSDKESDSESNFNFAKLNHSFPITIFETPSNELLSPVRDHILKASDMALILVSAESGITKYTTESIKRCQELNTPFEFVLTKFDLSSQSKVDDIISKFANMGINLEQMGGEYQMMSFSTVQDVETHKSNLIESIILQTSMSDKVKSTVDSNSVAEGYVLDSGKTKNQGFYSLMLVKIGKLKKGDYLVSGLNKVKIKLIKNDSGETVKELVPPECGYVYGFDKDTIPDLGTSFKAFEKENDSDKIIEINRFYSTKDEINNMVSERIKESLEEIDESDVNDNVKSVPVVIRSDVKAIAESLKVAVEKLKCTGISKTCGYKVLDANIGNLKQEDMDSLGENGLVITCNSPVSNTIENKMAKKGLKLISDSTMADIVKRAEEELSEYLGEKKLGRLVGTAQILKVFEASKKRKAAGCVVTFGRLEPVYDFRIMRGDKFLYYGKISSLRRTTEEASEILETESCGITFQDFNDFKVGDVIEAYID